MSAIELKNVKKYFKVSTINQETFLGHLINFDLIKKERKIILNDINLKINSGEFICFVGNNGSGKSTLLRVISGIYKNHTGTVNVKGKVISLINMSAGIKERLTMKENIFLLCSLFGLSKKETDKIIEDIADFSELKNYLDTKIYKFSSGMLQRLAFSIAIYCDPDVLILDEIFEVGDKNFKIKSSKKIKEMVNNGKTVLLVTHEMEMIKENGTRVIWLDNGKVRMDGSVETVLTAYLNSN